MIDDYEFGPEDELAVYLYTNYGIDALRELLKAKPRPALFEAWNLTEEQYIAQIEKAIHKILVD